MVNPERSATSPGASNKVSDIADAGYSLGIMNWTPFRGRALVALSVLTMCALAWAYLIYLVSEMPPMASATVVTSMGMPSDHAWELLDFTAMFVMWSVMMVAMMLPAATPMILLYVHINRKRESQGKTRNRIALFIGGYLLVWIGFSVLATLMNWALHSGGLLNSMMGLVTNGVAGISLLAAGTYQWTTLKYACLTHCRSPVGFLMAHWHEGRRGAARMGAHHGLYCLGCCWLLMVLLFVLGVMNLLWIAVLTVFVLAEKVVARGHLLGRIAGLLLIGWGGGLIFLAV